jgi:STE24 endopeptidase
MNAFAWLFLAALAAATLARLWLARRQIAHVLVHRDAVPTSFAGTVPLSAHQKAADYTVARTRLGMVEALLGAAWLLALTLGGGLRWIDARWASVLEPGGLAHGTALIASVAVLLSALELPASLYRTFVIEERHGFNRMTPRLFLADLAGRGARRGDRPPLLLRCSGS